MKLGINKMLSSATFLKALSGFTALVTILLQPMLVVACGVSIIPSQNNGENWTYGNDSAEQSFINYQKGTEKLIISRDFNNGSSQTVWVIPIPAEPGSIQTNVLSDTPKLAGYSVIDKANSKIPAIRDGLLKTQIYPAVAKLFTKDSTLPVSTGDGGIFVGVNGVASGASNSQPNTVVVYDHLEKDGMVVEVLSAGSSDDLYTYLKSKGLEVQKDSINILSGYVGKNFSFVANWIKPTGQTDPRKGLQMTFPTKKIFYPLKPGSVYPGPGLPETIHVMGYVSPKLYTNIKQDTKVDYLYSPEPYYADDFFESSGGYGFTDITVDVPPSSLTEDLYISQRTPIKIATAQAINSHIFMVGILLFIPITLISSLISTKIISRRTTIKPNALNLVLLSLLGIVGAIIGAVIYIKGSSSKRVIYVVSYSGIFVAITLLLSKVRF